MRERGPGMPLWRAFFVVLGIFTVLGGALGAVVWLAHYYPLVLAVALGGAAFGCIVWGVHKGWW